MNKEEEVLSVLKKENIYIYIYIKIRLINYKIKVSPFRGN